MAQVAVGTGGDTLRHPHHQREDDASVVRKGLLAVRTAGRDSGLVVAAVGDLDASTVEVLDEAIRQAEGADAQEIVVDLSGLTFMDSSGLRAILQAHARSQADSNRLRLVRGPRRVQRVFELTGMDSRLPFIG